MDRPAPSPPRLADPPPAGPLYGRLSIAHLLLITAGSAVAVWLQQVPGEATSVLEVAVSVLFAPIYGAALGILCLAVGLSLRRGQPFVAEPGHRLLVMIGATFGGVSLFWRTVIWIDPRPSPPHPLEVITAVFAIFFAVFLVLVAAVVLLVAVGEVREPRHWQFVFWMFVATIALPLMSCGCVMPFGPSDAMVGAFVLGCFGMLLAALHFAIVHAAIHDVRTQVRRDLWHWLGVAALFAVVCHAALLFILVLPGRWP